MHALVLKLRAHSHSADLIAYLQMFSDTNTFIHFFLYYFSWGKICGIILFLFSGSGLIMNVCCVCWVSLFVTSKMPLFLNTFHQMGLFLIHKERKSWSTFWVTLVWTQQWLLWKMACRKTRLKTWRQTELHVKHTHGHY